MRAQVESENTRWRKTTAASVFAAVGSHSADPPSFSLDVTVGDDACATLSVAGELDLATANEFLRAVRSGLATGAVLVDLRNVTFMDSSGVRALNMALRESAESDRELRLSAGMQPNVLQVLEMTGMLSATAAGGRAVSALERNNVIDARRPRRAADALRPRLRLRPEHVALRLAGVRRRATGSSSSTTSATGGSDASAYDRGRYASLDGYAADVLAICDELDLARRRLRRPLGQRDDRRRWPPPTRARALRPPRPRRAVAALHRRRGLRRRLHARGHRRACSSRSRATTSAGRARWRR